MIPSDTVYLFELVSLQDRHFAHLGLWTEYEIENGTVKGWHRQEGEGIRFKLHEYGDSIQSARRGIQTTWKNPVKCAHISWECCGYFVRNIKKFNNETQESTSISNHNEDNSINSSSMSITLWLLIIALTVGMSGCLVWCAWKHRRSVSTCD